MNLYSRRISRQLKPKYIFVISERTEERSALVRFYKKTVRRCLDSHGAERRFHLMKGISAAKKKIADGVTPFFIIFSSDFPEKKIDELRKYLDEMEMSVCFLIPQGLMTTSRAGLT